MLTDTSPTITEQLNSNLTDVPEVSTANKNPSTTQSLSLRTTRPSAKSSVQSTKSTNPKSMSTKVDDYDQISSSTTESGETTDDYSEASGAGSGSNELTTEEEYASQSEGN